MNGIAIFDDQTQAASAAYNVAFPDISDERQSMTATTLQIAIMAIALACLAWMAMRPGRRGGARRPSSGDSWSADAAYNIGDSGQHHGSSSHHSASDPSGPAGDGGSDAGGGDGGGGGSSD